jgi:hypothetical protein
MVQTQEVWEQSPNERLLRFRQRNKIDACLRIDVYLNSYRKTFVFLAA